MTINIKKNFWDENYYNHPALTDIMITKAEKELKVTLPKSLIDLLKIQNGGYTKGFVFPMQEKTSWAKDHIALDDLSGIVTDESLRTAQNILDSDYMTKEWGLPQKQVLLSGDGHWRITLDYRKGKTPSVRRIDTECNEDIHVADSFDDFIHGLVPKDQYGG